jgi:hypothetical protein
MSLLCRIFGHRLQTSVHARVPTLWCSRCQTVEWWMVGGLIIRSNCTSADVPTLGFMREIEPRDPPQGQGEA